jgi:hypothetical protein
MKPSLICALQYLTAIQAHAAGAHPGAVPVLPHLTRSLVRQIGEYLGQVDRNIKAIYHYQPVEPPEVTPPGPAHPYNGINLVIWVERKSAALGALLETFETALKASLAQIGCADFNTGCFTLDVRLVSDHEVLERRGLGMLVGDVTLRSSEVWKRPTLAARKRKKSR